MHPVHTCASHKRAINARTSNTSASAPATFVDMTLFSFKRKRVMQHWVHQLVMAEKQAGPWPFRSLSSRIRRRFYPLALTHRPPKPNPLPPKFMFVGTTGFFRQ